MTRFPMAWRGWAALIASAAFLLTACGHGSSSGPANLRVLNATGDIGSIDLYLNDGLTLAANLSNTLSNYTSISAQTYTLKLTSAGNPTTLFTSSWGWSSDTHSTGVVWGNNGSLAFTAIPEDDDTTLISANSSRIRVYNATTSTGAFDVYLTQNLADLSTAIPTSGSVGSGQLAGFKELTTSTYRLRVTTAGAPNEVRLDLPAVTLPPQQYATLILTSGPGGFLLNAAILVEQGSLTVLKNPSARLRVAAGAESAGVVSLQLDGQATGVGLQSPFVGPYSLVNAGSHAVDVRVDGNSLNNNLGTQVLAPGGDYTVLAYGTGANGTAQFITDDNRLPANLYYKIRLVNGAASAPLATLLVGSGYVSGASDVPLGAASTYTPFVATNTLTGTTMEVLSGSTTLQPVLTGLNPSTLGVYTVFVLGGDPTQLVRLSKDR